MNISPHKNGQKRGSPSRMAVAHRCTNMLQQPCKAFDGMSERACYRRIHGNMLNMYNIDESKELHQNLTATNASDIQQYWNCLKDVKQKTDACLPKLVEKCQERTIRATKLIRMRMQSVKYVLERDPFVKVIHYVRDPRGVLESQTRNVHYTNEKKRMIALVSNAINLCTKLNKDIKEYRELVKLYPNNFMTLRYEDLVSNPGGKLGEIYNFIGEELPQSVLAFFQNSMNAKKDAGAMATQRKNGTATAMKWKKSLDGETVLLVNRICGGAMAALNYTLV